MQVCGRRDDGRFPPRVTQNRTPIHNWLAERSWCQHGCRLDHAEPVGVDVGLHTLSREDAVAEPLSWLEVTPILCWGEILFVWVTSD